MCAPELGLLPLSVAVLSISPSVLSFLSLLFLALFFILCEEVGSCASAHSVCKDMGSGRVAVASGDYCIYSRCKGQGGVGGGLPG